MALVSMKSRPGAAVQICESCLKLFYPLRRVRLPAQKFPGIASYATLPSSPTPVPRRKPVQIANTHTRQPIQWRRNSTVIRNVPSEGGTSLQEQGDLVPLTNRRLLKLQGPDVPKFLQGLVTNNVPHETEKREPCYAGFLDARGRVLWDVFLWWVPTQEPIGDASHPTTVKDEGPVQWTCYIEVDAKELGSLEKHLKKHKLRSKVKIAREGAEGVGGSGHYEVWAGWGSEAYQPKPNAMPIESMEDPRALGFGNRFLMFSSTSDEVVKDDIGLENYRRRRYLFGIPEGQQEIPRESALPMECNMDLSSGIDFRKGCYVGQELTIRTKHTGVVRKRILPVQLYSAGESPLSDAGLVHPDFSQSFSVSSGADIKQLDESGSIKKGRAAGKFIAGAGNIGLAMCRLEMMTNMRVSAEGGSYKPGAQFGIAGSGDNEEPVRIKAIIPQWFRERERLMWDKGQRGLHQKAD